MPSRKHRVAAWGVIGAMAIVSAITLLSCGGGGSEGISKSIVVPPTTPSEFVYVANSGAGTVAEYKIDYATGALSVIAGSSVAAGTGASGLTSDRDGRFLFVTNLTASTVSAYSIDSVSGALTQVAGSPFPTGVGPISAAVVPTGKYLYVANRDAGTVSAYTINSATGSLTEVEGSPFGVGGFYRQVIVDPSGRFVYVIDNGLLQVDAFSIDSATGALTPVIGSPFQAGSNPQAVAITPLGNFLYVTDSIDFKTAEVLAYAVNANNGSLTLLPVSPFPVLPDATGAAIDPSGKFLYVTCDQLASLAAFTQSTASPVTSHGYQDHFWHQIQTRSR